MRYTVRPISDRTPFTGKHRRSPFDSTWSATEQLLEREVKVLDGRDLVVECDVTESQVRLDGGMYANARPATPAVRIAFASKHGPLTYATDAFTYWQDNVRAIALSLEALRRVDRYQVAQHGEQYTGWKAIEATPTGMRREAAIAVLALHGTNGVPAEHLNTQPDVLRSVVRRARRVTHPDRNGGSRVAWDQVEQAANALGVLG